jgi:hypothetical protein
VQVIKYAAWLSSEKAKVIPVKEVTSVWTWIYCQYEYIAFNGEKGTGYF